MDKTIKLALLTAGVSIVENKLRKKRVALGLSTLVIKPMRTAFTAAIECEDAVVFDSTLLSKSRSD